MIDMIEMSASRALFLNKGREYKIQDCGSYLRDFADGTQGFAFTWIDKSLENSYFVAMAVTDKLFDEIMNNDFRRYHRIPKKMFCAMRDCVYYVRDLRQVFNTVSIPGDGDRAIITRVFDFLMFTPNLKRINSELGTSYVEVNYADNRRATRARKAKQEGEAKRRRLFR